MNNNLLHQFGGEFAELDKNSIIKLKKVCKKTGNPRANFESPLFLRKWVSKIEDFDKIKSIFDKNIGDDYFSTYKRPEISNIIQIFPDNLESKLNFQFKIHENRFNISFDHKDQDYIKEIDKTYGIICFGPSASGKTTLMEKFFKDKKASVLKIDGGLLRDIDRNYINIRDIPCSLLPENHPLRLKFCSSEMLRKKNKELQTLSRSRSRSRSRSNSQKLSRSKSQTLSRSKSQKLSRSKSQTLSNSRSDILSDFCIGFEQLNKTDVVNTTEVDKDINIKLLMQNAIRAKLNGQRAKDYMLDSPRLFPSERLKYHLMSSLSNTRSIENLINEKISVYIAETSPNTIHFDLINNMKKKALEKKKSFEKINMLVWNFYEQIFRNGKFRQVKEGKIFTTEYNKFKSKIDDFFNKALENKNKDAQFIICFNIFNSKRLEEIHNFYKKNYTPSENIEDPNYPYYNLIKFSRIWVDNEFDISEDKDFIENKLRECSIFDHLLLFYTEWLNNRKTFYKDHSKKQIFKEFLKHYKFISKEDYNSVDDVYHFLMGNKAKNIKHEFVEKMKEEYNKDPNFSIRLTYEKVSYYKIYVIDFFEQEIFYQDYKDTLIKEINDIKLRFSKIDIDYATIDEYKKLLKDFISYNKDKLKLFENQEFKKILAELKNKLKPKIIEDYKPKAGNKFAKKSSRKLFNKIQKLLKNSISNKKFKLTSKLPNKLRNKKFTLQNKLKKIKRKKL